MAHFARIDNGTVVQVISVSNIDAPDPAPAHSERLGQAFIASLGLDGEWKQTSYHGTFRAHYAGIGYTYDTTNDVFIPPQPYPSWTLNTNTWQWEPPTPYPDDGSIYVWNEDSGSWVEVEQ